MDKIFIDGLETSGIIGIHPREQHIPQRIRVSASVSYNIHEAALRDDISQTINYSTLSRHILAFIEKSHYRTIEAFIESLADEILNSYPVHDILLRVEKPDAVPAAASVGVEIFRKNKNLEV